MKRIFQKLKDNGILITIYLQICRELSNLPIFFRVHSNSKEVAYLSYQNTYPNLNTTSLTVNVTPKELTPCKISHICRCAFNGCFSSNFYLILLCQQFKLTIFYLDESREFMYYEYDEVHFEYFSSIGRLTKFAVFFCKVSEAVIQRSSMEKHSPRAVL